MIYIQSNKEGYPQNVNMYIAKSGFEQMGYCTIPFFAFSELDGTTKEDIIIGGVESTRYIMNKHGIELPSLNYPDELKIYFGRRIWESTIKDVMDQEIINPFFIKPIKEKRFTGFVLNSFMDFVNFSRCEPNDKVLCSDVVNFKHEWRVFVRYGKIIDARPYYGDWKISYNAKVIEDAVNTYNENTAPAAYAIDFGVTDKGETLLVEVNDGCSVGCYGLNAIDYAKFLSARWCELTGIKDDCDFEFEGIIWYGRYKKMGRDSRNNT